LKYILTFIFIILITGCNKKEERAQNTDINKTSTSIQTQNTYSVTLDGLTLVFKNSKLQPVKNKTVLLFEDNSTYSKAQEAVLNKLNIKYYKTANPHLETYFNIENYPTIIVLDKNSTTRYENFTPYEILKAEGF
jgi:hypothetical protein